MCSICSSAKVNVDQFVNISTLSNDPFSRPLAILNASNEDLIRRVGQIVMKTRIRARMVVLDFGHLKRPQEFLTNISANFYFDTFLITKRKNRNTKSSFNYFTDSSSGFSLYRDFTENRSNWRQIRMTYVPSSYARSQENGEMKGIDVTVWKFVERKYNLETRWQISHAGYNGMYREVSVKLPISLHFA